MIDPEDVFLYEVEQPRRDHTTAAPEFRDIGKFEVVLILLRIAERGGFGVGRFAGLLADVGAAKDSQAFSVRRHHAVFDAVVDHFHEMAGAVRATVQITLLGRAAHLLAAGRFRNAALPRSERREDGLEMLQCRLLAADHHAVAPFQSPYASARADVNVVNRVRRQFLSAADVIHVVRVPAVDHDVTRLQKRHEVTDGVVHHRRWNHQPDRTRRRELRDQIGERRRSHGSLPRQLSDRLWRHVEHHALVPFSDDAPRHVGAHPSQTDHSQLHLCSPLKIVSRVKRRCHNE